MKEMLEIVEANVQDNKRKATVCTILEYLYVDLLKRLNRPVPNVISATRNGWIKPKNPPPNPSNICVDKRYELPISLQYMINAHRIGREKRANKNNGFRPNPRCVAASPAYVATAIVICAKTIAPAVNGMAALFCPSSSSPFCPISSPSTSKTLAFPKLFVKGRNEEVVMSNDARNRNDKVICVQP